MNKKFMNTLWILSMVTLALTACSSQNTAELLSGKSWELVSIGSEENPEPVVPNSQISLEFNLTDNKIGGTAGCNNYFAGFEINNDELSISAAGSTMMYCEPEELMVQETAYLMALGEVHHFSIQNGQLSIHYGEGQVLNFK